jgi:hypothetical protein
MSAINKSISLCSAISKAVEVALRAFWAGARAGEKAQPGAGEEAAGKEFLQAGVANAVHGALEVLAARIELVAC